MTITTRGRRDFVFYTSDAEGALRRLAPLQARIHTHSVQSAVERDTFWGMYRSFCGAPGEDESGEDDTGG